MTDNKKGTAWMDALDPNFGKVADEWMKVLVEDFGTDHWYQLDGYFNGKTAPWMEQRAGATEKSSLALAPLAPDRPVVPDPTWMRRGLSAYSGLSRTDPDAIWSFQVT